MNLSNNTQEARKDAYSGSFGLGMYDVHGCLERASGAATSESKRAHLDEGEQVCF